MSSATKVWKLVHLLTEYVAPEAFRRLALRLPKFRHILANLTTGPDTPSKFWLQTYEELARQGLIDLDLFLALQEELPPDLQQEFAAISQLFGLALPPQTHKAVAAPPVAFTPQWFARRFEAVKRNLDRRYRPDLHIEVFAQSALDGLTCSPDLKDRLQAVVAAFQESGREVLRAPSLEGQVPPPVAADVIQKVVESAGEIVLNGLAPVLLGPLRSAIDQALTLAADLSKQIEDQFQSAHLAGDKAKEQMAREHSDCYSRFVNSLVAFTVLDRQSLQFAESRFMVLTGEAGIGKSHLLATQVERRLQAGAPAIMLLGEHFQRGEPWAQILDNLGLGGLGADELLHKLEIAARSAQQRALIVIDALNESDADTHAMWRKHLHGIIGLLAAHPKIALLLSVRTGFEHAVLPDKLSNNHVVKHGGFAGYEATALTTFLRRYDLPPPQTPLLTPEHRNPLFLVLYCEAVHARRQAGDLRELSGFLEVFAAWVEQAANRAADRLGWDRHDQLFQRGIGVLAAELARTSARIIPRANAKHLLEQVLPKTDYRHSLFKALLDENVLTESKRGLMDYVRFEYERLGDIFTVRVLLDEHLARSRGITTFGRTRAMREMLAEPWSNAGRLDAMAIVLLQEHGVALHTLLPAKRRGAVWDVSLRVLAWHPASAVDDATVALVRASLADPLHRAQAIEALFLLAGRPLHPLNGRFLHAWLTPMTMPDRDEIWSLRLIAFDTQDESAVSRLLDWVEHDRPTTGIADDESLIPLALALGWTLATSNREIRDRATKALVSLFATRLAALVPWMELLQEANDPYVVERVLAVAYGATLRASTRQGLDVVASVVFRRWFDPGTPPVHILARDYARGVVEFANHHGLLEASLDIRKARPPYESTWTEALPSTKQLIARLGGPSTALVRSMVRGGDFDRYEVGSNSWRFAWSYQRIDQSANAPERWNIDTFLATLTEKDRAAWAAYAEASEIQLRFDRIFFDPALRRRIERTRRPARSSAAPPLAHVHYGLAQGFSAALQNVTHILSAMERVPRDTNQFPIEVVRQHLLHEVIELGWSEPRFAAIDRQIGRASDFGRSRRSAERIGKKYQWIALHRVLAQVADRFRYTGNDGRDGDDTYHGPWQLNRRDIDPTCLLKRTAAQRYKHLSCWWSPTPEHIWKDHRAQEGASLMLADRLPDPTRLLRVMDDKGIVWLVLHTMRDWDESRSLKDVEIDLPSRQLRYFVRAYVIRKDTRDAFIAWSRTKNFYNERVLEDAGDITPELMLRERGWSPAWRDFNIPYFSRPGWTEPEDLGHQVLPAWDLYMVEGSSNDAAIEEGYTLHMPAVELVELLSLRHDGSDGHFVDTNGRIAAFDPSIAQAGPRASLLREDLLQSLRERGFDLVWALHGEDFVSGPQRRSSGMFRNLSGAFVQEASEMMGYLHCTAGHEGQDLITLEFPARSRDKPLL